MKLCLDLLQMQMCLLGKTKVYYLEWDWSLDCPPNQRKKVSNVDVLKEIRKFIDSEHFKMNYTRICALKPVYTAQAVCLPSVYPFFSMDLLQGVILLL